MAFWMSKLFWAAAAPGNLLLLVLALGVLRRDGRRRRRGFRLVAAATAALLIIAAVPVGQWIAQPLERRFPAPELPPRVDGIIVLGGVVESGITHAHGQVALNDAAERLVEAVRLARRYPQAKLLMSGGDAALLPDADVAPEADLMRDFMVQQGIEPARILVEGRSRNTFENAEFSRDLVRPQPGETWVLVTSAVHMPRAVGCFRHVGWQVVPYPVDFRTGAVAPPRFLLSEHLPLVDLAAKEWVGLVAYRLAGRIDAIFPAP